MKLLIEERIFSWNDRFTVRDETGNDRYYVEGELFSWGKKLHVCDISGREVAYIEQQIFTFKPRYSVYVGGQLIGEVVREFSFFRPRFIIDCNSWQVDGDWFEWDYHILDAKGQRIADVSKELFRWTDTYVIDVRDPNHATCILMLVLAIDAEKCSRRD